jgi:hypothetical protein
MNIFPRKKKEEAEETPSDVRKAYDSQINHFLRQVEGPNLNPFRQRENPLNTLLNLAASALNEKQKLQEQLEAQASFSQRTQKKNDELRRRLQEVEAQLQQASMNREQTPMRHENKIIELTQEHSKSLDDSRRKLDSTVQTYENRLESLTFEHNKALTKAGHIHAAKINEKEGHIRGIKAENAKEVERLVRQLLVNQQADQEWTDEKLKHNFRELQRLIESVTAPSNRELIVPQDQKLGPPLDPYNFLDREGRGKCHFLLKSAIWSILYQQFFSAPFGFGIFGPGKGQAQLIAVYHSWLKLIDDRTCKLFHNQSPLFMNFLT